jgi:hypothetical protein
MRDGCARIASRRPGQLHRHGAVAPETRAMHYPRQASWFRLSFPDAIEVASGWVSVCVPAYGEFLRQGPGLLAGIFDETDHLRECIGKKDHL